MDAFQRDRMEQLRQLADDVESGAVIVRGIKVKHRLRSPEKTMVASYTREAKPEHQDKPGQAVFLRSNCMIDDNRYATLNEQIKAAVKGTGIKVVLLDKGIEFCGMTERAGAGGYVMSCSLCDDAAVVFLDPEKVGSRYSPRCQACKEKPVYYK